MSATFAVPCTCGHKPDHWRHGPRRDGYHANLFHRYAPNDSSVEWAALKLREALAGLLRHWALGGSEDNMEDRVQVAREALALAEAAGIKAP